MDRLAASINHEGQPPRRDAPLPRATITSIADAAPGPDIDLITLARDLSARARALELRLAPGTTRQDDAGGAQVRPARSRRAIEYRAALLERYRRHASLSAALADDGRGLLFDARSAESEFPALLLEADGPVATLGKARDLDGNDYIDLRRQARIATPADSGETLAAARLQLAQAARATFDRPLWTLTSTPAEARDLAIRAARGTTGRTLIALIGSFERTPGLAYLALDDTGLCVACDPGSPSSAAADYLCLQANPQACAMIDRLSDTLAGVVVQTGALQSVLTATNKSALHGACARAGAALIVDAGGGGMRDLATLEEDLLGDLLLCTVEPGDSIALLGGEGAWLRGLQDTPRTPLAASAGTVAQAAAALHWYQDTGRAELRGLPARHEHLRDELETRLREHARGITVEVVHGGIEVRLQDGTSARAPEPDLVAAALALRGVLVSPGSSWALHPAHDADTIKTVVEEIAAVFAELAANDCLGTGVTLSKPAETLAPLAVKSRQVDAGERQAPEATARAERTLRYWRSEYADGVPAQSLIAPTATAPARDDIVSLFCWRADDLAERLERAPLLRDRDRAIGPVVACAIGLGTLGDCRDLVIGLIPPGASQALPLRVPLVDDGEVADYLDLVGAIVADGLDNRDCDWVRLANELASRADGSRTLIDCAVALDPGASPVEDAIAPGLTLELCATGAALECVAHYDRRRIDGAAAASCGTLAQAVLETLTELATDARFDALPSMAARADCPTDAAGSGASEATAADQDEHGTEIIAAETAADLPTDTPPPSADESAHRALVADLTQEHSEELAEALNGNRPEPARLTTSDAAAFAVPGYALRAGEVREIAPLSELLWSSLTVNRSRHAVYFNGKHVSYADITAEAMAIAARLAAAGAEPDQPVGLLARRAPSAIAAMLGTLLAGCGYLPLDPRYPQARRQLMLDNSGISHLVAEPELADDLNCEALTLIDLTERSAAPGDWQRRSGKLGSLLYTSGSSGVPKGVAVTSRAMANFIQSIARTPGVGPDDRVLAIASFSFDIHILEIIVPLCVGGTIVLADDETHTEPQPILSLLKRGRVSLMQATPTLWGQCLDADAGDGLQGVRAFSGGEPLSPATRVRLARGCAELWNLYGPTETTVYSSGARQHLGEDDIHVGGPMDNTRIAIVDETTGTLAKIGELGEIWIAGAGLASHYWNDTERTAAAFVDFETPLGVERYYRSGDRGFVDAEGRLHCRGRADQQVKLRGHRIELLEIEHALCDFEPVERAACALHSYSSSDIRLVAYYQCRPTEAETNVPTNAQFREHLAQRLPAFMLPQIYLPLEDWPLLANGKLDRSALPRPPLAAPAEGDAEAASTKALARALWCELIGVASVADDDNFFELGGHSVLAMQFVDAISERCDKELPVRALVLHDLAEVAAMIDAQPQVSARPLRRALGRLFDRLRPAG
ncbi:MAG: amino acid adenylation domain-containing protein [Pseudomonadota bacterium]